MQEGKGGTRQQNGDLVAAAPVSSTLLSQPHLISPGAVTTRLRKIWQQVCRPISTLSGSTEVSWPGDVSSHCCRKYLHRREGAPSLIRISRGPSSTVR